MPSRSHRGARPFSTWLKAEGLSELRTSPCPAGTPSVGPRGSRRPCASSASMAPSWAVFTCLDPFGAFASKGPGRCPECLGADLSEPEARRSGGLGAAHLLPGQGRGLSAQPPMAAGQRPTRPAGRVAEPPRRLSGACRWHLRAGDGGATG